MAAIGCITKPELLEKIKSNSWDLCLFENKSFWGAPIRKLLRLITKGHMVDLSSVRETCKNTSGDMTFKEAYEKTGLIINITVSDAGKYETFHVMNYLTAPNVLVWSAAVASCSVPFLFSPSKIYTKDENGNMSEWLPGERKFVDGSLDADLPRRRMAECFNCNYAIASQANPFVIPFLSRAKSNLHSKKYWFWKVYEYLMYFVYSEIQHRTNQLARTNLLPSFLNRMLNMVTQYYTGDITVHLQPSMMDMLQCFNNPTLDRIEN